VKKWQEKNVGIFVVSAVSNSTMRKNCYKKIISKVVLGGGVVIPSKEGNKNKSL
jgi:hypothetical protein